MQAICSKEKKLSPFVSIILLNYNGKKFLEGCLNSLFSTNYNNFEILLIDNNSSDGSVQFVKNKFRDQRLKIISLDKNIGVGGGNNVGASYARGKYLIFLNTDTDVHEEWLNELISVFEKDINIGAAQPKLLFSWDKRRINSMGHFLRSWGSWSNYVPIGKYDDVKKNDIQEIFIAFGAAIAVKRDIFYKIGMFDQDFFMYSEETDLCWRIWLNGQKVVLVPSSIVYHYEGGVAGGGVIKPTPLRTYYHTRNLLTTILKNYGNNNLLKYFPIIILNTFYGSLRHFNKNPKLITYNFLAIIDFIKSFNSNWKKRIKIQHLIRRIPDDTLFKKGLIRARRTR